MPLYVPNTFLRFQVPNFDRAIKTSREYNIVKFWKLDWLNPVGMAFQSEQEGSGLDAPYFDGIITSCWGYFFSLRRKINAIYGLFMTF